MIVPVIDAEIFASVFVCGSSFFERKGRDNRVLGPRFLVSKKTPIDKPHLRNEPLCYNFLSEYTLVVQSYINSFFIL